MGSIQEKARKSRDTATLRILILALIVVLFNEQTLHPLPNFVLISKEELKFSWAL